MVFVGGIQDASALQKYLKKQGILIGGYKDDLVRFALHNDIKRNDIDTLIQNMEEYLQEV
jgi:threonine aldolase